MKRICALLLLILSVTLVPAVYGDGGCTDATLTGNYSYNFKGWFPTVDKKGHLVLASSVMTDVTGVGTFDGAGKFTGSWTQCFNGVCGPGSDKGTYSVKSDCSGKVVVGKGKNASHYNIAIANGGNQIYVIQSGTGVDISGMATKQ
jgi:hypothetical protein